MSHPYADRPDYCFWRRSVAGVPMHAVDPVVRGRFRLTRRERIASAGSCFAQHMARHLVGAGYNYLLTESLNPLIEPELAPDYNFGVFTARFGNIYTARQFRQLLLRAFGQFTPVDDAWPAADGSVIDPYRPLIQPNGFANRRAYDADRAQHFAAVRRMVTEADVLVFTLGLTEAWENIEDGAIYPLCPGTAAGEFDPYKHRFVNFSMFQVLADMQAAFAFIRARNPGIRFIITVSPVPLVATAEDRHVLVSTTYSKSVLRTVCGELEAADPAIAYFPSYEIITGSFSRGSYYEPDAREVNEHGVRHVMDLFLRHYGDGGEAAQRATGGSDSAADALLRAINAAARIICDEVALDRP
jgi:hypothetical protein